MHLNCTKLLFAILAALFLACSSKLKEETREYFVRPIEFVCDYTFNDTTKWVIACRVWGLLKYYHPNVTAGKFDWDKVLLDRIDDINRSSTPEMLNAELKKMLDTAGKYKYIRDKNWNDSLNMNMNLCWIGGSFLDELLQNELIKIASLSVEYPSFYGMDYIDMTWAPHNEKSYNIAIHSSYQHRLLALFRYWNVIYYFFPHKYLMDQSWDKVLSESIFPFINADVKQSYEIELLKLAAKLNDSHAFSVEKPHLSNNNNQMIAFVEGNTVSRIDNGVLKKGDIVKTIEGRDIGQIRDSLAVLIPASTKGRKEYRINRYVADIVFFKEMDVAVLRKDKEIHLRTQLFPTEQQQLPTFQKITNDIGYVDLSQLLTEEIDSMFHFFVNTKAIIFDLRQYNGDTSYDWSLLSCYLSTKKGMPLMFSVLPNYQSPGAFFWGEIVAMPINTDCHYQYSGAIVFLVDESVQSYLETKAWIARQHYAATLFGRTTSGAWGHVVRFNLPGNHSVVFSGVALFSLDNTELQRKGIIPDIEVHPTIDDILEGRDEILEAAILYINSSSMTEN